jgi:hypothetical protein
MGGARVSSGPDSKQDYKTQADLMAALVGRFGPITFDLAALAENTQSPNYFAPCTGPEGPLPFDPKAYAIDAFDQDWAKLSTNTFRRSGWSGLLWLTQNDFARELARIDLPLSTYTQWYWKIDLHNLLHFLTLRVDAHAQWEIQQYGVIIAGMLKRVAPICYEAWIDYDVCGARLSRMELDLIRTLRNVGYEQLFSDLDPEMASETSTNSYGLTTREYEEFKEHFHDRSMPNFELDLSTAKDASYFEEAAKAAVPGAK